MDNPPGNGPTLELLFGVRAKEPWAIERWYRAEHPQVWRTCLGLVAEPAEADDLAQDAMLKIADRLDRWDPTVPYIAWRTKVVVNLCRDQRRRTDARRRAEDAGAVARPVKPLPDPSEIASQAELQEIVRGVLQQLPEREREAFVLRELERLTTTETAAAMDIGESTVRSLTTLARRRLRGLLEPGWPNVNRTREAPVAEQRDPLDDLRSLWDELDAPEPDHSDAPRDERADAATAWMRSAYGRLEAPIPELPWVLRRRRVARSAAVFAAAALFAGVLLTLAPDGNDGVPMSDVAEVQHVPTKVDPQHPVDQAQHEDLDDSRVTMPFAAYDGRIRTTIDESGRIVVRNGSVDLVWVAPNHTPTLDPTLDSTERDYR